MNALQRVWDRLAQWLDAQPEPVDDNALNGVAQERARRSQAWEEA